MRIRHNPRTQLSDRIPSGLLVIAQLVEIYRSLDELQQGLYAGIASYNTKRDSMRIAKDKVLENKHDEDSTKSKEKVYFGGCRRWPFPAKSYTNFCLYLSDFHCRMWPHGAFLL